jgi:excisionase family DNA binding protein
MRELPPGGRRKDGGELMSEGVGVGSPWLDVQEAAARANCGAKLIYREVKAGRLKAARIGGRRELRLLAEWVDTWLLGTAIHTR